MKINRYKKAIVSLIVSFVFLITSVQAANVTVIDKDNRLTEGMGWYWKPSYPNYSPQGLPDFDQKQACHHS